MRIPNAPDLDAAWDALPPEKRREIGRLALDMVFQGFLAGSAYPEDDKVLSDPVARAQADDLSSAALMRIFAATEAALPDLFGPDGEHPAWAEEAATGHP